MKERVNGTCRVCAHLCCSRPAPVGRDHLAHAAGKSVCDTPYEFQWHFRCYSCDAICRCEV